MLLAKMDEFGKVGWITLIVLGFWIAWPLGLVALGFALGSGRLRMSCAGGPGAWFGGDEQERAGGPWARRRGRRAARTARDSQPSGNAAFDFYREETLRRLEDEENEFREFLERLRKARDKSEFDAFMAERRNRNTPSTDVNGESV